MRYSGPAKKTMVQSNNVFMIRHGHYTSCNNANKLHKDTNLKTFYANKEHMNTTKQVVATGDP